jgi:hypothetical protein
VDPAWCANGRVEPPDTRETAGLVAAPRCYWGAGLSTGPTSRSAAPRRWRPASDPARAAAQLLHHGTDVGEVRSQPFCLPDGFAIAGIIKLQHIRPIGLPKIIGVASQNAAHRVTVEWDTDNGVRQGVYIAHRHSGSRLNALLGGRVFPGVHARPGGGSGMDK